MIVEDLMILLMLAFCIYASVSDIRHGIISNRFILIFISSAILLDCIYYIFIAPEMLTSFGINVAIICCIAAVMYASHSWAGGDCKFLIAIGLAYPAKCYLYFMDNNYTFYLSVCLAFIAAFFYLFIDAIAVALKGTLKINIQTVKAGLLQFIKNYFSVMLYIVAINLIYSCIISAFFQIHSLILTAVYMCAALCISSFNTLKSRALLIAVSVFDVAMSLIFWVIPINTNVINYLLILFAVFFRIIVANQNYKEIPTGNVEKGMILAAVSTITFPQSKISGLPNISKEDLRSRLTESEAQSVRNWENSKYGSHTVLIMRKAPFAIFITIGVLCYLLLWGVIK